MKVKIFFLSGLFFLFALNGFSNEKPERPSPAKSPRIAVVNSTYTFDKLVEGQEVLHDFIVKNNGNATLEIRKVHPG